MAASSLPKVIILIGPTASGKTKLAVRLADSINGEIISADSRQVFRGMDIGSGKDLADYGTIPYHLIDIREPGESFSVSDFQIEARRALEDIISRKKVPIICGGTMYYVKALIEDYRFTDPKSSIPYTHQLESLDRNTLYDMIKARGLWDTHHWENDSRRRMARAIEKWDNNDSKKHSSVPPFSSSYAFRIFYTSVDRQDLRGRIRTRLTQRLEEGLIEEVQSLLTEKVRAEQLDRYGLEYRWVTKLLTGKIELSEMTDRLSTEIARFAKRQMTFIRFLEKQGHRLIPVSSFSDLREHLQDWFEF